MSPAPAAYPTLNKREDIMSVNEPGPREHGGPMDY